VSSAKDSSSIESFGLFGRVGIYIVFNEVNLSSFSGSFEILGKDGSYGNSPFGICGRLFDGI